MSKEIDSLLKQIDKLCRDNNVIISACGCCNGIKVLNKDWSEIEYYNYLEFGAD